jgi:hypothetical protein
MYAMSGCSICDWAMKVEAGTVPEFRVAHQPGYIKPDVNRPQLGLPSLNHLRLSEGAFVAA